MKACAVFRRVGWILDFQESSYDNGPEWVFERDGIRAAIEPKDAGQVRHIGCTGDKDPLILPALYSTEAPPLSTLGSTNAPLY